MPHLVHLVIACLALFFPGIKAWRHPKTWNTRPWCLQAQNPSWPFAYSKRNTSLADGQPIEWEPKGRTTNNTQWLGHICALKGAQSTCHICERIACADGATCDLQLQGTEWTNLPRNIPTATDVPFAVGPQVQHRYDFGNAQRVCLMQGNYECATRSPADAQEPSCHVRCWGAADGQFEPGPRGWQPPTARASAQGLVTTFAGSGKKGDANGAARVARFAAPQGVAVDKSGNVYVADTDNHAIRRIVSGIVETYAGSGISGYRDGAATAARFSSPSSVAVYEKCNQASVCDSVVIVADTHNHRIRRIYLNVVSTVAGGAGFTEDDFDFGPNGYNDGNGTEARFDTPMGVAVDAAGIIFVADTRNHLIRYILQDGSVHTLAGKLVAQREPVMGCPHPCMTGQQGLADGPVSQAEFYAPYSVAIGPGVPPTVVVSDGNRVRIITRQGQSFFSSPDVRNLRQLNFSISDIGSLDTVSTLSGNFQSGKGDWFGDVATHHGPRGLAMSVDEVLYVTDSATCRVRRITSAHTAAVALLRNSTLYQIMRPAACTSKDQPSDSLDHMITEVSGGTYYNLNNTEKALDGRRLPICLGVQPPDYGIVATALPLNATGGTVNTYFSQDEDELVGTSILVRCAPVNGSTAQTAVLQYSPNLYPISTPLCAAAEHEGLLNAWDDTVMLLTVHKGRGSSSFSRIPAASSTLNASSISFSLSKVLEPFNTTVVNTIAGAPSAPLETSCGYSDISPPTAAKFATPSGIALDANGSLFIADSRNHAVRLLSGGCTFPCENGGVCVGPDRCICPAGWAGMDCTVAVCATSCGVNRICSGPNTCTCLPGYSGADCKQALCVQTCMHGGRCSAPDTCSCTKGWFDANCTSPVCKQTCGNGGNCTAPNTCTCPALWTGYDCRSPVCPQGCANGGVCVAPNTCRCTPSWSGHDCSKPVCHQGYFRPDPVPRFAPGNWRESQWRRFLPCDYSKWCNSTNEFECIQQQKQVTVDIWPGVRDLTGSSRDRTSCFEIELSVDAVTPFSYLDETNTLSPYMRNSHIVPYGWGPSYSANPWSSPFPATSDRQIPFLMYANATEGVYVCANGGDCIAPDTCKCAEGWIGFDCRTPICRQGYYYPDRISPRYTAQGTYHVSNRTLTLWENPLTPNGKFQSYMHDHPNFRSIDEDMDVRLNLPTTHQFIGGLGDNTNEGWRRDGWWVKVPLVDWQHGNFPQLYSRACVQQSKRIDLVTREIRPVGDPDLAFRARISYDDYRVTTDGEWNELGGECTDEVLLGCFNGGTCVGPNTCLCLPGWEGDDCSLPKCWQSIRDVTSLPEEPFTLLRASGVNYGNAVASPSLPGDILLQYRECPNRGNCTRPDTCTCEKGWTGPDCRTPLCAQECFNGGECIAPDVCDCVTVPSTYKDKRGLPLFMRPDGEPQHTGWTGFDCNTPICVQAERWVPNDDTGQYPEELTFTSNDGTSFQGGCLAPAFPPVSRTRFSEELCGVARWHQGNFLQPWANAYPDSARSVGRDIRINYPNYVRLVNGTTFFGPPVYGEGIYACFNRGSCIAPDACACEAGWHGYDCNVPDCNFLNANGVVVQGCLNGGICGSPNKCNCVQYPSLLHEVHSSMPMGELTGWRGSDCSMPMCTQGYFDPTCQGVEPIIGGPASAGEGCYRCANGGNCTSPDRCKCASGWTGFDCRTPVCMVRATEVISRELKTIDVERIEAFERDPCGHGTMEVYKGLQVARGNCTRPNVCTCLCKKRGRYRADGTLEEQPWSPPAARNPPVGYIFGRFDCLDGFEGVLNDDGSFATCHLKIYVPTFWEVHAMTILLAIFIPIAVLLCLGACLRYRYVVYLKRKKREERRRKARNLDKDTRTPTPAPAQ